MPSFKLIRYSQLNSLPRIGILINDTVYDLEAAMVATEHSVPFSPVDPLTVLHDWDRVRPAIDFIETKISSGMLDDIQIPLKEVNLKAPVTRPGMLYSAEANYRDYLKEMTNNPQPSEHQKPFIIPQSARGAIIGPNEDIVLPNHASKIDWQAEIAIVIGCQGKNIRVQKATEHIAGYTIINNLSARDLTKRYDVPFTFDWFALKNFDKSTPLGPWITPRDALPDTSDLSIKLWVNKQLKQDSSTKHLIVPFDALVSYISNHITLYPGDIIATGTPAGCGVVNGECLQAGDTVRIAIEGIGELINTVSSPL